MTLKNEINFVLLNPPHTLVQESCQLLVQKPATLTRRFKMSRVRLSLECLEERELMATGLSAGFSDGILRIQGTELADSIQVRCINNQISVDGATIQTSSGNMSSLLADSINRLEIYANGGDDVRELLTRPLEAASSGFAAQVIATGPTYRSSAMPELFSTLVFAAKHQLFITTPYYVPNEALQAALERSGGADDALGSMRGARRGIVDQHAEIVGQAGKLMNLRSHYGSPRSG